MSNRIADFVSAARTLLVMQMLAALLATGIAVWAFVEVRGMAVERDRLKARVIELEAQRAVVAPVTQVPLLPMPEQQYNEFIPPAILPPVEIVPPPVTTIPVPEPDRPQVPDQADEQAAEPPTPPRLDCAGADRGRPGCRPIPERPPIRELPDRLTPRGDRLGPQPPG